MRTDMKKDSRSSLTLYLSARQGDLLKEILSRELTNARSKGKNARVRELSKTLITVQDALNLAEHFVEMRNLAKKEESKCGL